MESNKWLWQPHKTGPIYLRLSYRDAGGRQKTFVRTLNTSHWPTARATRDKEFAPIVRSIDEARAKLELIHVLYPELEQKLQTGVHGGFTEEAKVATIKEVLDGYARAMLRPGNFQTAERTAKRYATICGSFAVHVGVDRAVTAVTTEDVVSYRDHRLEECGTSKKTVDVDLIAIRGMFNYAAERHGLTTNPATGVTVKRTKAERNRETRQCRRRPPTHDEADKLCTWTPRPNRQYTTQHFQDFAMMARYSAMRQGEIAQLRVDDIMLFPADAFVDQVINQPASYRKPFSGAIPDGMVPCFYIADRDDRTTKTGLERVVPVAQKLLPVVRRLITAKGPLFPFAVKDKGAIFGRWWLKQAKRVHSELTMHGFRHYATSEMENQGVNTAVSKLILGHESQNDVHENYAHREIRLLKAAVDVIR